MEIIPADDESSDANAEAAHTARLDSNPAVHEPLGVELLEDKVLLATDAAGAAAPIEAVADEPAPLSAAPVAGAEAGHKLALIADATSGGAETDPPSPVSAASGGPHEPVEAPREVLERPGPEDGHAIERLAHDAEEMEAGTDEFGLATIEPEKSKSIHSRDAAKMLEPVDASHLQTDERGDASQAGDGAPASEPALDVRILDELGQERPAPALAASLAEEAAIAPLLGDSAATPAAQATLAEHQESLAATSPGADTKEAHTKEADTKEASHAAQRASQAHLADSVDRPEDVDSYHPEALGRPIRPSADVAKPPLPEEPAAHDAIFAAGGGVEAVIDQGTSRDDLVKQVSVQHG